MGSLAKQPVNGCGVGVASPAGTPSTIAAIEGRGLVYSSTGKGGVRHTACKLASVKQESAVYNHFFTQVTKYRLSDVHVKCKGTC